MKTTTIEIKEDCMESDESSNTPANTAEFAELLKARIGEEPSELWNLIIERGRLAKAKRRAGQL